jgi:predicted nucleic acid-binding Zn ribbon protein
MSDAPDSEARSVFLRFKRVFGEPGMRSSDARKRAKKNETTSVPYGADRDPFELGAVLDGLTSRLGWNSPLARSELIASWSEIVGEETAAHSHPIGIEDGVLSVQCDSTAWATQLRLMRSQVTTQIAQRFPEAGIDSVRFQGPNAPSWKRGTRSIPGRGPRDTYG